MNAIPKPIRERDQAYMDWIKTQRCWLESLGECTGPIDPHHVVPKGGGKTGSKVSDRRCIPLCRLHHDWAGTHPELLRMQFAVEDLIWSLSQQFDALFAKTVKAPRAMQPAVKLLLIRCDCGLTHRVPRAKVTFRLNGATFYCAKAKAEKTAPWSAA